ncbi:hypothetical protein HPB47_002668 [Ixodes persulcatus]|uniref:Uncharacterized protein n=1 Tax=Ixodes persulcatus TaxID=34615 RepID=A0AC60PLS4_IXOPE|nr:hypothetical protein HPB47_002668 [Ixodes persulcatus]
MEEEKAEAAVPPTMETNNGKAGASIDKIKVSTEQISNMIRRVTNSRRGLKEDDALTLVQAFLKLLKKDRDQLNAIIRKETKMSLGMPKHSSTDKLLGMAKHNVVEELIEAHLSNQRVRLSQTSAGRRVLAKLGWQEADRKETGPLPRLWVHKIDSKPLPRNMRPGRSDGRRAAPTLAVTTRDAIVTCASIKTSFPEVAEEAAIALALAQTKTYNSYRRGWVSLVELDILKRKRDGPERNVELIWTPAYSGMKGNELVHQFAREIEHRRWETLLTSPVLEVQLVLISRGQAAREAYGSREEGTTSIDGV